MAMTSAERQSRYRERVRARAGEGVEAAIERIRQTFVAEWIADADSALNPSKEAAFLQRVAARPMWHERGFEEWLEGVVAYEVERDVTAARKEEKQALSADRKRWRAAERTEARRTQRTTDRPADG